MLQEKALRRHAAPLLTARSGSPLIKSSAALGRRNEWRKGLSTVDADMPEDLRKKKVYQDFLVFRDWMKKEDGAHFLGKVKVSGPFPHFDPHEPDIQYGDSGGSRKVARSIERDTQNNGKEDYVIEALFNVPEYITELPTDLAVELFGNGRPGIRPLREREWRNRGTKWSPRS